MTKWLELIEGVNCRVMRDYAVAIYVCDSDGLASDIDIGSLLTAELGGTWVINGEWEEHKGNQYSHWHRIGEKT